VAQRHGGTIGIHSVENADCTVTPAMRDDDKERQE